MGDPSTIPENGSGLFKGSDGKLSGRKILGFAGFIVGTLLGGFAIYKGIVWASIAIVMGAPYGFSLFLYGFVTAQNAKEIIAAAKGG
jgi:hypothetical protein